MSVLQQNNRLLTETKAACGVDEVTTYNYDTNGNTLTAITGSDVISYTYNHKDQQISWSDGTNTVTYTYNLDGLRASKTNTGVGITINYVWSGGNMVYEYATGYATTGIKHYYGLTLFHSSNGNFHLYNAHGDVIQLIDEDGEVLRLYKYDAFGNEKNPDPNDTNYFRYAGQYFDIESGTYYLRARYYNPANGRFTQQDAWMYGSINDPLSLNLYAYCHQNPIRYYDPSGHFPILLVFALATLVVTLSSCKGSTVKTYGSGQTFDEQEMKMLNPGCYNSYEEVLNKSLDVAHEYASTKSYEHGIFVYKNDDYYYASTPYNSHHTHFISKEEAEGKIVIDPDVVLRPNPDAEILAFIHTHPQHNDNLIFTEKEILYFYDFDYYVVDPGGCTYKADSNSMVDEMAQYPVRKGSCWRGENY